MNEKAKLPQQHHREHTTIPSCKCAISFCSRALRANINYLRKCSFFIERVCVCVPCAVCISCHKKIFIKRSRGRSQFAQNVRVEKDNKQLTTLACPHHKYIEKWRKTTLRWEREKRWHTRKTDTLVCDKQRAPHRDCSHRGKTNFSIDHLPENYTLCTCTSPITNRSAHIFFS